jgi:cation:H+ antiporter
LYHEDIHRRPAQRGAIALVPLTLLALLAAEAAIRQVSPLTLIWAGPALLFSALLIAWGAESAQFFIAQGFALAILAWLQTLPEFAVEAVLAWHQQVHYLLANLTGALRILTGLGWPAIYFAAATVHRKRTGRPLRSIELEKDHAVEVIGLFVPLLYITFVWWKGSLDVYDSVVLIFIYAAYLFLLMKMAPVEHEGIEDLEAIPRAIVLSPRPRRIALITLCFTAGGLLIYLTAEPFLASLLAVAVLLGIPSFVFIQWVAPFVSEFPEMASTFYWARTVVRAPMALMNMVSSNINQWTLLTAMLPIIYSLSRGSASVIVFDQRQSVELLMTIGQAALGLLFIINMELAWWEASVLFVLWLVQFVLSALTPDDPQAAGKMQNVHWIITIIYFVWAGWEALRLLMGQRKPVAFREFARISRQHF